ncbi:MAG: response regulator transcription factor [Treponema sp.]|nr:response regulator transcription factor [Treponema sp.]
MTNTLFIVDDHFMIRSGLTFWLESKTNWKITGNYSSSKECLEILEKMQIENHPEIIVIDIQLQDESGFELLSQVTKKYPHIKCLMYSMYDTAGYILQAKDNGAKGFISKVSSEEELLKALKTIQTGGMYIEPRFESMQKKLESITCVLSKQEKVVFEKLLQGKTNEQIKNELFISSHSVANYVSYIYTLTDVHNRNEFMAKFKE